MKGKELFKAFLEIIQIIYIAEVSRGFPLYPFTTKK